MHLKTITEKVLTFKSRFYFMKVLRIISLKLRTHHRIFKTAGNHRQLAEVVVCTIQISHLVFQRLNSHNHSKNEVTV